MAPRKGKGRQAVRNSNGGMPGWGWAIIGVLIGVVLMVLARSHLPMGGKSGDVPQANPQATAQRGSDAGAEQPPAADGGAPKKPQYDFYSVLSEKEVRIPDAVISAQAKAEQQQKQQAAQAAAAAQQQQAAAQQKPPANAPNAVTENITAAPATPAQPAASGTGGGYLLQVAALPSASEAESLKAKLALQGFVANVATVNVNGQTYNRVRLGPFKSATELEATQQRLRSAGISAIALKEGK
ncbi:SPOR domain-containing protein [Dyella sp.]|uniref:SPOR domain-containing protein n=1 Tax=Dyella sp. TaxID=1869338 RepID=UPI002ED1947C